MKTCLIIVLSLVGMQSCAQFSIGVRSGLSLPGLRCTHEKSEASGWREAAYGGMHLSIQLNRLFSLQPELNYSPQGGENNGLQEVSPDNVYGIKLPTTLYASFDRRSVLNYLEIPILLTMKAGREVIYKAYGGPYIAFLLSAKTQTRGSSRLYLDKNGQVPYAPNGEPIPAFSFDQNTNLWKTVRKINGGVQGGLGVGYPLRGGRFLIDVRGILGMTNIHTDLAKDGQNKTGSLLMTVGYELDLR